VVNASVGRYGPYVVHDRKYVSLKEPMAVLNITLERAVALLAAAPEKRGTTRETLKELGEHPDDGKPVRVYNGRYGPYVNHGRINATLPKDSEPTEVTMAQALELIEKRKARKKTRRKKAK